MVVWGIGCNLRGLGHVAQIAAVLEETQMTLITRMLKNESGATAIEYGLIAALIAVTIIAAASFVGNSLDNTFSNIASNLD